MAVEELVGREKELAALASLVEESIRSGSALVIEGDAGIGKTALLDRTVRLARDAGYRILRCTGIEGSTALGYAGLHELLHPLLPYVDALPPRQRRALLAAFAMDDGPSPDRLVVSIAALGLLEEAAARQPLMIAVEDLQWLDRSSAHVLTFLGLRLSTGPIALVLALRTGGETDAPALPRLPLGPLDDADAHALVDRVAGDLSAAARARVVREGCGNPLALREIATALRGRDTPHALLPSMKRLERALHDQLRPLPARSRAVLVLAAAADGAPARDVMAAARGLGLGVEDLSPLESAGLITVDGAEIRFRHSLLRSAVQSSATTGEWVEAHRALAGAMSGQDRAAWHRAAATMERDETVAGDLEQAGRRARDRGAQPEAAYAFARAADLSADGGPRLRRLAMAAETARSAGMTAEAVELLARVEPVAADAETLAQAALTRIILSLTANAPIPERHELDRFLAGLESPEHVDRRVTVLWGASVLARGRNLPQPEWERLRRELAAANTASPLKTVALALLAPHGQVAAARDRLPGLVPLLVDHPLGMVSLAVAAESLQDLDTALTCWGLSQQRFHDYGMAADETQALRGRAQTLLLCGRIREGLADAEYAERMTRETGQPLIGSMAVATAARAHALLGNAAEAEAAIRHSAWLSRRTSLALIDADARWAAGLLCLTQNRFRDAVAEFEKMAVHPTRSLWAVADRTEAAVRADQADTVREQVDQAAAAATAYRSPYLAALVARSRALLAQGDHAARDHAARDHAARDHAARDHAARDEAAGDKAAGDKAGGDDAAGVEFEQAVRLGMVSESRFELARTRLVYGEWLRRRRQVREAREQLAAALAEFEAAGAKDFADRAAAELRAAGEKPQRSPDNDRISERLTAQEFQIAQLAADGMSNKEIADRIYLSHRTVSSHLYRVFPKLGITNRSQLGRALAEAPGPGPGQPGPGQPGPA